MLQASVTAVAIVAEAVVRHIEPQTPIEYVSKEIVVIYRILAGLAGNHQCDLGEKPIEEVWNCSLIFKKKKTLLIENKNFLMLISNDQWVIKN